MRSLEEGTGRVTQSMIEEAVARARVELGAGRDFALGPETWGRFITPALSISVAEGPGFVDDPPERSPLEFHDEVFSSEDEEEEGEN